MAIRPISREQGNCGAAIVGKFDALAYIRAANVNFTVCTVFIQS